MIAQDQTEIKRKLVLYSRLSAGIALLCGLIPVIGWVSSVPTLYQLHPTWPEMVPETILQVVLAAMAIWVSSAHPHQPDASHNGDSAPFRMLAGGLLLVGVGTLVFYLGNGGGPMELPLLFRPKPSSPRSAICFAVLGASFFLSCSQSRWLNDLALHLLVVPFAIAMLALIGYVSTFSAFYSAVDGIGMSVPTAAAVVLLCVGAFQGPLCNTHRGILYARGTGGQIVRNLLPTVVLLPLILSLSILTVAVRENTPDPVIVALLTLSPSLILGAVVFYAALRLERSQQAAGRLRRQKREVTVAFEEYKVATSSRDRLAAIVRSSKDAILGYTMEGTITSWNEAAERLFGYCSEEAVGKRLDQIANGDTTNLAAVLHKPNQKALPSEIESTWCHKSGIEIPVACSSSPIVDTDGNVTGISCIVRDVSALHREIQQRQKSQTALRDALQIRDNFIRTVSHELRTPLSVITGWVDLLRSGTFQGKEVRPAYDVLERNAGLLRRLVDDILDLSRLTRGALEMKTGKVRLDSLVSEAVANIQTQAEQKKISIELKFSDPPPSAVIDPDRISQIVSNLLTNAVKFTPDGGEIGIDVRSHKKNAEISVTDSGIGIDPQFLPHLFEGFRQSDSSRTRSHGGLGIGLAIAEQLAKAHGGTLSAFSGGEGQGSTFTLTLPLATQRQTVSDPPTPSPSHPKENLEDIKVLVVDDDPDLLELVQATLEEEGATVLTAQSAREAHSVIEREPPSIIICDIGMPEEDGIDFIRRLRATDNSGSQIPAVAHTAYATEEDRAKALQAGFDEHLGKPATKSALCESIKQMLS